MEVSVYILMTSQYRVLMSLPMLPAFGPWIPPSEYGGPSLTPLRRTKKGTGSGLTHFHLRKFAP